MRTAPVAVARQPHHLPRRPVDRQRRAAAEAALIIGADRMRRSGKRRRFAREQLLGWGRGVRMLQQRQRLGMKRAGRRRIDQMFFLRGGRTGGEEKEGEQASGSAHQRLLFVATVALWADLWADLWAAFLPRSSLA